MHAAPLAAVALLAGTAAGRTLPSQSRPDPQLAAPKIHIRVRVLDEHGAPLAGAGLAVGLSGDTTSDEALDAPVARSDADGRMSHTLERRGALAMPGVEAWIAAKGRVPFRVVLSWLAAAPNETDRETALGDIRLPRGIQLTGRLRARDGSAIANASVFANDLLNTDSVGPGYAARTTSNKDGVFRIRSTFSSGMSLDLNANGYYHEHIPWVRAGTPLQFAMEPSGFVQATVAFSARDLKPGAQAEGTGDEPFSGFATVIGEFSRLAGQRATPVEVQNGTLRIGVSTRGRFRIAVYDRYTMPFGQSAILAGPTDEDVRINPLHQARKTLTVRARDEATAEPIVAGLRAASIPLPDVSDWLQAYLANSSLPGNKEGRVRLFQSLEGSIGSVYAVADGYAPLIIEGVALMPGAKIVTKLFAAASIRGKVVRANGGKPIANARVSWRRIGDQVEGETVALPRGAKCMTQHAAVHTTAQGAFSCEDLMPGQYEVTASWSEGSVQATRQVAVGTGKAVSDLSIELEEGITCIARIDGLSQRHPHARVLRVRPAGAKDGESRPTKLQAPWLIAGSLVSADDRAEFPHLAEADLQLRLVVPVPPRNGYAIQVPLRRTDDRQQNGDTVEWTYDLAASLPGFVTGKVQVDGTDVSLARFVVYVFDEPRAEPGHISSAAGVCHFGAVAPDGSFSVPCGPGNKKLAVVDIATAVLLHVHKEQVQVPAGGHSKNVLLKPTITQLDVRWSGADGRRIPIEGLAASSTRNDELGHHLGTLLSSVGRRGVMYNGATPAVPITLIVPVGEVSLQPYYGTNVLELQKISYSSDDDPTPTKIQCAGGERNVVTLPAPEPLKFH
ncbi:MAG: carboxypeptidase-like regulatory domain-containing protein [Planctomycetota bacterium]